MITVILLVIVILIIMSLVYLVDTKCSKKCDNVEHLDDDENMCFDNDNIERCSAGPRTNEYIVRRNPFYKDKDYNIRKCDRPILCEYVEYDGGGYYCNSYKCKNIPKGSDISKLDPRWNTFTS